MDAQFLTFTSRAYFDLFPQATDRKAGRIFLGGFFQVLMYSLLCTQKWNTGMGVTNDERDDLAVLNDKDSHSIGVQFDKHLSNQTC